MDLARRFCAADVPVLIGGFHVSGAMPPEGTPPPELTALLDLGVTLVKGEIEESWEQILRDVISGTLRPVYDLLTARPDLAEAPIPHLDRRLMRRFAFRHFGTLDTSRGCPFTCSFCTIINIQGRGRELPDARYAPLLPDGRQLRA
jgi:radical SAM superfamily enzyme YgiQ (UPF0313 family)